MWSENVTTAGESKAAVRNLAAMCVRDIRNSAVEHVAVIAPDSSVSKLLRKVAENLHIHHIYVIDTNDTLVGCVNLDTVLKYLFPFVGKATLIYPNLLEVLAYLGASSVSDLMSTSCPFVHEDTPVIKAAEIMIEEALEEIPVLDSKNRLIGEVTLEEIVGAHLKIKGG